jgi:hypothetical protein
MRLASRLPSLAFKQKASINRKENRSNLKKMLVNFLFNKKGSMGLSRKILLTVLRGTLNKQKTFLKDLELAENN